MYETKINELSASKRPGKTIKSLVDAVLVKRIRSHMRSAEEREEEISLLEIGTGSGHLAKLMLASDSRLRYVGVEPTETLRMATLELLAPFGTRVRVVDGMLPELAGIHDSAFDACILFHLLEHATDQIEGHRWLTSIFNKMKPGGRVIIVCPNIFDYKSYFYDGDWSHGYPTTTRRIELLGVDAGFTSVEATDLRANSDNFFLKGLLALSSKVIPTELLNRVGHKAFGVPYIGMGLQAAIFWRNCWVVLEKPTERETAKNG